VNHPVTDRVTFLFFYRLGYVGEIDEEEFEQMMGGWRSGSICCTSRLWLDKPLYVPWWAPNAYWNPL